MSAAAVPSTTLAATLRRVRRSVASLLLTTLILSPYGVLAAPVADTTAPAAQQPTVSSVSGVSVVNIVAPNSAGVSHNKYQSFDVPAPGVVLNNATTGVNTTLAGAVAANPNLGGSAASIILNEVTGSQASLLAGTLEVAGQAAKVILANPNGITCNGCGFINTPHVQLTTGRPTVNGSQITFDVLDGRINIGPDGLDALAVRLDAISRFINVGGPVNVAEANLYAGRAYVDADTLARSDLGRPDGAPAPFQSSNTYAIDISQSLSAGTIRLVLSDGDGIRATAPLNATNDIGVVGNTYMQLDDLYAGRNIAVFAPELLPVTLTNLYAGDTLQVVADRIVAPADAYWRAGNDIQIGNLGDNSDNWGELLNLGRMEAGRDFLVALSAGGNSAYNRGVMSAGRDFHIGAGFELLPAIAEQALTQPLCCRTPSTLISGGGAIDNSIGPFRDAAFNWVYDGPAGRIEAGHDLYLTYGPNSGGTIAAGDDIHIIGYATMYGVRQLESIFGPGNAAGTTRSGRDIIVEALPDATQEYVTRDRLIAGRDAVFMSDGENPFQVSAPGNIQVAATDASFTNRGSLVAGNNVDAAADVFSNTATVSVVQKTYPDEHYAGCTAGDGSTCRAMEDELVSTSLISAGHNVTITANSVANIGSSIVAGNDVTIQADAVNNSDRILDANWTAIPAPAPSIGSSGGGGGSSGSTTFIPPPTDPITGTTQIGVVPGVIQAGHRFLVNGIVQSDATATGADAASAGSGAATPPPAASFTNSGTITAPIMVVHADQILNGYGFTDHTTQTAPPSIPPAAISLYAPPVALLPTALDPSALASLLPASLQSPLPFALSAEQEETALQNALIAQTGRAYIVSVGDSSDGLSPADQQRAVLYANAVAWALENGVPLGQAPSAQQLADLSAPMLWYVARDGVLVPTLYLPDSLRNSLALLPGGNLTGLDAVSLNADSVTNTGYIRSGGLLQVTADSLANEKRNAEFNPFDVDVDHGYVHVWGDTVQPGGFMQAAAWDLAVSSLTSVSGEFSAGDEAATASLLAGLRASLGGNFSESVTQDHIYQEFVCTDCEDDWFGALLGVVLSFTIGAYLTPYLSGLFAEGAAADSVLAAGTWSNAALSQGLSTMASNVATQLVVTGEVDGEAALRAGLAGGFTAGFDTWARASIADPTGRWVVERLADGVAGTIREQSFAQALQWSVADSAGATAANWIGNGNLGPQGSLTHTLAHGALGALLAEAKGMDPVAGAIGGVVSDVAAPLIDQGTGLSGQDRYVAVTALDMLTAGLVSHAAGHDATTAAMTAQNEVLNNYLSHTQMGNILDRLRQCKAQNNCAQIAEQLKNDIVAWSNANDQRLAQCMTQQCVAAIDAEIAEANTLLQQVQVADLLAGTGIRSSVVDAQAARVAHEQAGQNVVEYQKFQNWKASSCSGSDMACLKAYVAGNQAANEQTAQAMLLLVGGGLTAWGFKEAAVAIRAACQFGSAACLGAIGSVATDLAGIEALGGSSLSVSMTAKLEAQIAKDIAAAKSANASNLAGNGEGLFTNVPRAPYTPANPVLGQAYDFSCAAASCSMAANLASTPEAYIRQAILTDTTGTSLSNIPSGLKQLGFSGTAEYSGAITTQSISSATSSGASVIVNVTTETGGVHAIVVDSVTNGMANIRDPWPLGVGSSYSVPVEALGTALTGKGVVIYP